MNKEHFAARASLRRRIGRLPVNAVNRHVALEEFVAGEHAASRIVYAMKTVHQFLTNVRPLLRLRQSA
jgi:hypothetical protein